MVSDQGVNGVLIRGGVNGVLIRGGEGQWCPDSGGSMVS